MHDNAANVQHSCLLVARSSEEDDLDIGIIFNTLKLEGWLTCVFHKNRFDRTIIEYTC